MKIVLVTGASVGIGKATAEIFAANGYNVIITGRRKGHLDALKLELESKYKVTVWVSNFDIQDPKAVVKAIADLPKDWQKIDVLVNNAGLALGKTGIDEGEIGDWEVMIDTNLKGLLYISKEVIRLMKKYKSGHIINLSSTAAKEVYPGGNVYCATKHAVDAITKGMRIDLLPYDIKVTSVSPGMVATAFSEVRFKGDKDLADSVYQGFTPLYAEDVADAIYYAASRPAHVNIGDILITCSAQANSTIVKKN